jgi:hypothetical protein
MLQACSRWASYKADHPASKVSPVLQVVVRAFFVEHVAVGLGGRRGGLYAKRVPNFRYIRQNDPTPFILVELGGTRAGRSMPSGKWVRLHGKFDRGICTVYDVTGWSRVV